MPEDPDGFHNYVITTLTNEFSIQSFNRMFLFSKNKVEMTYHLKEVDFVGNGSFSSCSPEDWIIGNKKIITPHGTLKISSYKMVEQNGMVGIQFSVKGSLDFSTMCRGVILEIRTIAFFRQPQNACLWGYAFDKADYPIANFCGNDDLDGLRDFVCEIEKI